MAGEFVPNPQGLETLLRGNEGAVMRDMRRRAKRVEDSARVLAPKKTGKLAASVHSEVGTDGQGVYARIFAATPYAPFVQEGTGPHSIVARNVKFLSFVVGGVRVTVRSVQHPGTKPKPFLIEALRYAIV